MARIAGVELPKNKRVEVALTYIFGIGISTSHKILEKTGVSPDTRVKNLTSEEIAKLREEMQNYKLEGALRNEISRNIKKLIDIGCYRGLRHKAGLPVRGQRTRSNARTRRGPRGNMLKRVKKGGK